MKAKCPYCKEGCGRCKEGFIEVSLAKGTVWTQHCNTCGFDNGGSIREGGPPKYQPQPCVMCESPSVEWKDTEIEM